MSEEERKSINNGIWLCQSCAKLIDSDENKYTVQLIKNWKEQTESMVGYNLGKRIILSQKNKLEYIFETLRDTENWAEIRDENIEGYYYKENPSYKIEIISEDNYNTEFYSYLMTNESTSFSMLYLKYNDTCIYSKQIVSLDSGRLTTVVPSDEFIHIRKFPYKYKYFIKDSQDSILRDFLYNYPKGYDDYEEKYAMKRLNKIVIEFESIDEFEDFKNSYMYNIDYDKINEYGSNYTYAGSTDLEIKNNQIEIGLGLYMKEKYNEYKKIKKENKIC